jgi:hypothetical protein
MSRRLVSLSWFAVHPPRRGAQARLAGILGHLGPAWRVEHFSQVPQRTDLPWPASTIQVSATVAEHHLRDPVSLAWFLAASRAGFPPVGTGRLLGLLPRARLRKALAEADVVLVSQPYQVAWVRAATPPRTPVVLDAPNIDGQLYGDGTGVVASRFREAVRRAEAEAWTLVDAALAATEGDATMLRQGGVPAVTLVPNGVDLERVRPAAPPARAAARRRLGLPADACLALFLGSAHPPNLEAVAALRAGLDAYRAAGVHLLIVGRCGTRRDSAEGITCTGEVVDVLPYLHAADLAICPLTRGGGSSVKVPEYLAAGLPLVSTAAGVRGLDLVEGREALVCARREIAATAGRLAADAGRRAAMSAAARAVAEARFGWAAAGAAAAEALDGAIEAGRSTGPAAQAPGMAPRARS